MSIVVAFSGGLDTSFCVPYLKEQHGARVITVTVDTGGWNAEELEAIGARAAAVGSDEHVVVDGRSELFADHIGYLIKGNVLRGATYPVCVGAERVVQARHVAAVAAARGARKIAHGSTGAGNDQVRFDVALRCLAPDIEILAPVRSLGLSRNATTAFLRERSIEVSDERSIYSVNAGLWGTTIGGKETLTTESPLPEDAFPGAKPADAPDEPFDLTIGWQGGVPVQLNDTAYGPVDLLKLLTEIGRAHGIGRGHHVGDTILGIKGRVGFEAPAAAILIAAHRELEKLVLTKWQRYHKDHLADFYGMMLHEGQYFDPVMRDIESLIDSSQATVSGTVDVRLFKGSVSVLGCKSPYSLFDADVASYGEVNSAWDGRDAEGFGRIYGLASSLATKARAELKTKT